MFCFGVYYILTMNQENQPLPPAYKAGTKIVVTQPNSIYSNLTGTIISVATTPNGRYYSVRLKDHRMALWFDSADISL